MLQLMMESDQTWIEESMKALLLGNLLVWM